MMIASNEKTFWSSRLLAALLLAGLCLLPSVVKLACYPSYPGSDDAFIHLAIIENIHQGHGWGINEHEPVFLSTSPLFTVFFAAIREITPHVLEVGMVLSSAAGAFYILGMFVLGCHVSGGRKVWGFTSAALAASNIHLWRWNGTFMEVTFAMAAVVWLVNGFLRLQDRPASRRPILFFVGGIGLAAAVFLRPELGLLGVAFLVHSAINDRHRLVKNFTAMAGGFAIILLPVLCALYLYFGTMLPTTLAAKSSAHLLGVNATVWIQLLKVTASGCLGSVLLMVGTLAIIRPTADLLRHRAKTSTLIWLFPLLGFCFYSLKMSHLQSAARYYLPFMALIPALASAMGPICSDRNRRIPVLATVFCVLQLAIALVWNERLLRPVLSGMMTGYVSTMRDAATQIGNRARPGEAALIFVDIGVVAATRPSGIRILDGGRLASPELQGLTLTEMIRASSPRFVLESLGTEDRFVERTLRQSGGEARLVWSRRVQTYSVEHAGDIYEARLFELGKPR